MRLLSGTLALGLVIALAGCRNASEPGGGAERRDQFTVKAPATSTSIKQGETKTIDLSISRGKDFTESVLLTAEAPKGLDVAISPTSLTTNDKEVHVKVTAHNDAPVGNESVRVVAKPASGKETHVDVKVKVNEAERTAVNTNPKTNDGTVAKTDHKVTLSGPLTSTTVKQGTATTVDLKVNRDKDFKDDVKFVVEAPKDIKAEVTPAVLHATDKKDFSIKLDVDRNAKLGDHIVRVTAASANAPAAVTEVRVKVTEK